MTVAAADRLSVIAVPFSLACAFVDAHHRHHAAPQGHRFSLGAATGRGVLVGVAIVGRPVARKFDDGATVEVTRVATDGTPNACSLLYGAAWRTAKAAGYRRAITYTQDGESGASLRGAGWLPAGSRRARPGWDRPSRPRTDRGTDHVARFLWEVTNDRVAVVLPCDLTWHAAPRDGAEQLAIDLPKPTGH
ncbi:hypothetical protein GCM10022221_67440 [Actinocorallia aurea]